MSQPFPPIKNPQLLQQALTHRSYVNEHPEEGKDNERLEFLGDAVLGFLVGEFLYNRYPEMSEAQLTRIRANLVDETQFAKFARMLKAGQKMRLGKGAEKDGGRDNPALLCDVFEALIGAYFYESGIEAVKTYIQPFLLTALEQMDLPKNNQDMTQIVDAKNRFQQWSLAEYGKNPDYVLIKSSGPDHAKEFVVQVQVLGKCYGEGKGRRKQTAEKEAAEDALKKLEIQSSN